MPIAANEIGRANSEVALQFLAEGGHLFFIRNGGHGSRLQDVMQVHDFGKVVGAPAKALRIRKVSGVRRHEDRRPSELAPNSLGHR